MFITGNLRESEREPFFKSIRYSVSVSDKRESKRIQDVAVSVDISTGGLGMLTNYPIEAGHVLNFEDEIMTGNIIARAAVVKWSEGIIGNKYRVGVKFL